MRALVNLSAPVVAVALSLLTCVLINTTQASSLHGSFILAPPMVPLGLTVELAFLVLAAALIPTVMPMQRSRSSPAACAGDPPPRQPR